MNLWWSWHHDARMLFKELNRPAWKLSLHNPVKTLQETSKTRLDAAANDVQFVKQYDSVMAKFKDYMNQDKTWFQENMTCGEQLPIVYLSAEYGLHHSLPFYAGGLGFLAGDFLKECSDLGVPVIGIGFMYPEGYLHQRLVLDGWQTNEKEILDRENAPASIMLNEKNEPFILQIPDMKPSIYFRVWNIQIGRVPLYLLDTDMEINAPWERSISSRLYAGDHEQRLQQQIILGRGGMQVLNALGVKNFFLHLNEDYPAFAIMERIREKVSAGMSYDEAAQQVKKTTMFTTHTPVAAGHHVFPFTLMDKYFGSYWQSLKLDRDNFFKLGINPEAPAAGFNMTCFALRMSTYRNAVSKKHGEVTRGMWRSLWPELPERKIPIVHITNGVHVPTWVEPRIESLFNRYLGVNWLNNHDDEDMWKLIDTIPDEELWKTHYWLKMKLMLRIRGRARQRLREAADPLIILASGVLLDPDVLTIGFARRFAVYKRATLILRDKDRLRKIVCNRWRPLQIIFAGKAHPDDNPGKKLLQEVFEVAKDPSFEGRIAFVEDYDEQIAQYMVHGVDLWLNNPLPPFEASGTSGMKASLNGVPNFSILDGWWLESFNGKNGWGFGQTGGEDRDASDSEEMYRILENQIIPLYYQVDNCGIPFEWVKIMKEAMKSTASSFSARRMAKEYVRLIRSGF